MENEVIEVKNIISDLPVIADDQIIALANRAEKRIEAVNKLKKLALKVTNRHDWTDQQGKPYMQVSGAEKVARLFGISWQIGEPTFEQEEGGHFSYTYRGVFSISGATIEVIGTRSSKDGFFKKYKWINDVKTELPISEIDRGDVKKAAFTNCIGSGITRLLGIRNLTWEDLAEAGIKPEDVGKVDYKKDGKKQPPKQNTKSPEREIQDPDAPASPNQVDAINKMLGALGLKDDFARHEKASRLAGIPDPKVIMSTKELTKGQASAVIKALGIEMDEKRKAAKK